MSNIEDVFKELSEDCIEKLEANQRSKINIIGNEERCKKFLDFLNNRSNNKYKTRIDINSNSRNRGKHFYTIEIDYFYDHLRT